MSKGVFTHPVYACVFRIAFFSNYLGWLKSSSKVLKKRNAMQCGKHMRKWDVATWL